MINIYVDTLHLYLWLDFLLAISLYTDQWLAFLLMPYVYAGN